MELLPPARCRIAFRRVFGHGRTSLKGLTVTLRRRRHRRKDRRPPRPLLLRARGKSTTTRLPVNPASPGSSASMAGCGPAISRRPSATSSRSLARWAFRAPMPEREAVLDVFADDRVPHTSDSDCGRCRFVLLRRHRQPDALDDDEDNRHPEHAEQLELDPEGFAERIRHVKVDSRPRR